MSERCVHGEGYAPPLGKDLGGCTCVCDAAIAAAEAMVELRRREADYRKVAAEAPSRWNALARAAKDRVPSRR